MSKPIYLYKAMRAGFNSHHGKKKWKPGKWYRVKRADLKMCGNGFHASERIIDAMGYVPMEILAKVEVRGKSKKQDDKQCWSEMRIVEAWKWTKEDSVALSIYAAGLVLENFEKGFPDDKRPRKAIEAARRWLKNPIEENQKAAESAARSAESAARSAWSAAWSAESAAWSAESAAWSAWSAVWPASWSAESAAWSAWSAAWSAAESARSAWSAARSAMLDRIETWVRKRIKKLEKIYD